MDLTNIVELFLFEIKWQTGVIFVILIENIIIKNNFLIT